MLKKGGGGQDYQPFLMTTRQTKSADISTSISIPVRSMTCTQKPYPITDEGGTPPPPRKKLGGGGPSILLVGVDGKKVICRTTYKKSKGE